MVQSYLRHGPTESFGLVASSSSNSLFDGRRAYVPALEDVLVWDVKKGEQTGMWHETGLQSLVTCLARSPVNWDQFAVGYADGSVRLWSAATTEVTVTLNGHKTAVTSLAWDLDGTRLASGSKDSDVIVWDTIGEVGLFRLRGHRDQITGLAFLAAPVAVQDEEGANNDETVEATQGPTTHLLSSSKDTFLKLWSLATQHCIETLVGHRGEAWSFAYDPKSGVLVSGGGEGEVKCWAVDGAALASGPTTDAATGKLRRAIRSIAPLNLANVSHNHNVTQITMHPTLPVLAVLSGEKSVAVYRLRTAEELRKKLARRRRREREKAKAGKGKGKQTEEDEDEDEDDEMDGQGGESEWRDRLALWLTVRATGKIRSFAFAPETAKTKGDIQIMTALANNSLEVYTVLPAPSSKTVVEPDRLYTLDIPGHRTDVRSLAVSSDDVLLASASNGQLKVWNIKTTKCVRTMDCGYAICCSFLPGDKHIVVGTKSGELLLFDLSSSSLLESFPAHTGALWGLHVRPDSRGLVTVSADKDVKFWDFEVREIVVGGAGEDGDETESGAGTKQRALTLAHTKTLKMTDDVLAVKYSPDGRLLAVSLLDSTVKVFYADTLKFFLSLYGHKLPVLSLDISSDSKLIITCSADKNIKIWGLDFGDCHRSLFAHEESIMQVAFERGTHNFWSVAKDKMLKYWDGDKFECIQKLSGHSGEVWALAVSHRANFVATGSHDKSIRIWEKTEEPLFLEEERERELELAYDASAADQRQRDEMRVQSAAAANGEEADTGPESSEVTKSTTETLMAGERIVEALDIAMTDIALSKQYEDEVKGLTPEQKAKVPAPVRSPMFQLYGGCGPEEYVFRTCRAVPAAGLQDALLVLPFERVAQLISMCEVWARRGWQPPLTSRILFFLLRTHHSQIIATRTLRETMSNVRKSLRAALGEQKRVLGYNLSGLEFIKRQHDAAKVAEFYEADGGMADEKVVRDQIDAALKKRKRATMRS